MLKNRNIFSLIAHSIATAIAIWIATTLLSTGGGIFESGTDIGESGAGIFSLILWLIAVLLIFFALIPFIAVFIGWAAYFSRVSWLTLTSAILYASISLFSTGEVSNLLFLPSAALAFVGWLQERKPKAL